MRAFSLSSGVQRPFSGNTDITRIVLPQETWIRSILLVVIWLVYDRALLLSSDVRSPACGLSAPLRHCQRKFSHLFCDSSCCVVDHIISKPPDHIQINRSTGGRFLVGALVGVNIHIAFSRKKPDAYEHTHWAFKSAIHFAVLGENQEHRHPQQHPDFHQP